MGSAFETDFAADVTPNLFERFGRLVTLQADDETDLVVTGLLDASAGDEVVDESGTYNVRRWSLEVKPADVTEPRIWQRVVIGSETWAIVKVSSEDAVSVVFALATEAATELGQPDYRD